MSTSSSGSPSMADTDTTASTSPTTSTTSSSPSPRKEARPPPWIVHHISAARIPCELPLRIMFSFNTGQKLPMLKDVNHYWHYETQGKLIGQFLSSLGPITPSVVDAPLAQITSPQDAKPDATFNPDHAEGDRFMDHGNDSLLNFDFAKLAGDNTPSTKAGLPAVVIKDTCRRIFTKDYEKVQFNQALTGLDYLRDMELTRRGKLRQAATRLGISLTTWKMVLQDTPDALRWIELLQQYELKIEGYYANAFIDIRIWTMVAELKEEPFNKPNVLAMLNTLFPPAVQELPNDRIQPKTLHQYRSMFFRYITAIEKNGILILKGFEEKLQRADNRHSWNSTWDNMQYYISLAEMMIAQADAAIGLGIDLFVKGNYTNESPLARINADDPNSWFPEENEEEGTFYGPRSRKNTMKDKDESLGLKPPPKFTNLGNGSLRSLISNKFKSRTNLREDAGPEVPVLPPGLSRSRTGTADSTMSFIPPSLTRSNTFDTTTTVSPTFSTSEWPTFSRSDTARSSYSFDSPTISGTGTASQSDSIVTAKANPARSLRSVPSLPKLDTASIQQRQRAVSKPVMPFDITDSPAALHEAFQTNAMLPSSTFRIREGGNYITESRRPSTSHGEAAPKFDGFSARRPSTSTDREKPALAELDTFRPDSFYDAHMNSPSMPPPLTLGRPLKVEKEKSQPLNVRRATKSDREKPLPSDGGAFLSRPYTEPPPPMEKSLKKKSSFSNLFTRKKSVDNLKFEEPDALGITTPTTPGPSKIPVRPIKPILKTSKSMGNLPKDRQLTVDTSAIPRPPLRTQRSFGESLRARFTKKPEAPPLPSPKSVAFSPDVHFSPNVTHSPTPADASEFVKEPKESKKSVKPPKAATKTPVDEKASSSIKFAPEPSKNSKVAVKAPIDEKVSSTVAPWTGVAPTSSAVKEPRIEEKATSAISPSTDLVRSTSVASRKSRQINEEMVSALIRSTSQATRRPRKASSAPEIETEPEPAASEASVPSNIFTEPSRSYKVDLDPLIVLARNKEQEAKEAARDTPRMPLRLNSPHFASFPTALPPRRLLPGPDAKINAQLKEQVGISYFDSDENDMYVRKPTKLKKERSFNKKKIDKAMMENIPEHMIYRSNSANSVRTVKPVFLDFEEGFAGVPFGGVHGARAPMEPVIMTTTEERLGPLLRDFKIVKADESHEQYVIVAEGNGEEDLPTPSDRGLEHPGETNGLEEMLRVRGARSMPNLKKNVLQKDTRERKGTVSKRDISGPLELELESEDEEFSPRLLQDECMWDELDEETRSKEWSRKWLLENVRAKKNGWHLNKPKGPRINRALEDKKMKPESETPVLENGEMAGPKREKVARPPSFEEPRATPKPQKLPPKKPRHADSIFKLPPPPKIPPPPPIGSKSYDEYLRAYKARQRAQGVKGG